MSKLNAAIKLHKENNKESKPTHEVWIPFPEKAAAKEIGVRWSSTNNRHEIATDNIDNHPAARYLPINYFKLKERVPFEFKEQFKEAGVVNVLKDDVWSSYIMNDDTYEEVIQTLVELELL